MFVLYSVFLAVLLLLISYPYIKFYQLNGYDIKLFLENIFYCPFRLDDKNSLVFTKRIIRFLCVYFLILTCVFIPIFLYVTNFWLILLDFVIVAILLPIFISLAHLLVAPFEKAIKNYYIFKTKKFLKDFKGKKIAIVGSYGKTSVKNILNEILKDSYETVASPKNYNTPMGVCLTTKLISKNTEVAIFEMGARRKGEIKELVDIVDPDLGIMTAVGEQHIETFNDLSTIKETKFELVKNIKLNGKVVFNCASDNTYELYKKCDKTKFLACKKGGISWFENLEYSSDGLSFDMIIDSKKARVKTKLLGRLNCQNIVLASTVAYLLGVDFETVCKKIETLNPIKSRLEIIENKNFVIIDDSYNANIEGVQNALEVLSSFQGEKIVVTSGLVELGSLQYEKNFNLGKQIGFVADKVLIMNEVNKKAILQGLKQTGFKMDNVWFALTRLEQKEVLKKITSKGCVVLFQNDLPDNYK